MPMHVSTRAKVMTLSKGRVYVWVVWVCARPLRNLNTKRSNTTLQNILQMALAVHLKNL